MESELRISESKATWVLIFAVIYLAYSLILVEDHLLAFAREAKVSQKENTSLIVLRQSNELNRTVTIELANFRREIGILLEKQNVIIAHEIDQTEDHLEALVEILELKIAEKK